MDVIARNRVMSYIITIILRYIQRGFFDRIKSMAISSFK